MNVSKKLLWTTVGTMAVGCLGYMLTTVRHYRRKVSDREFLKQELAVLEGEGGICLT